MKEDFWSFEPTHKLVLVTNHKPIVRGTDHGIWRRIKLIPWTVKVPKTQQDKRLTEKLRGELPGILNWAILGCIEWQKDGLQDPDDVLLATDGYRNDMDIVKQFIATSCLIGDDYVVESQELYKAYKDFCNDAGEKPISNTRFGMQMNGKFEKGRQPGTGRTIRKGIGLVAREKSL